MKLLKRQGIPKLLNLALIVITILAMLLFVLVHQVDEPAFTKLQTLTINRFNARGGLERDQTLEIFQNDDSFFEKLLNPRTNSSQDHITASQSFHNEKSKFETRRHFLNTKRISSYEKMIKQSQQETNISVRENKDIFRVESQRRPANFSRNISRDNSQVYETPSDSSKRVYSTKSSRQFSEEDNTFKVGEIISEKNGKSADSAKTNPKWLKNKRSKTYNNTNEFITQTRSTNEGKLKPNVPIIHRDSDKLPKASSTRLKPRLQHKHGGYPQPTTIKRIRESYQPTKAFLGKTKTYLHPNSSQSLSNYKVTRKSNITKALRHPGQLPRGSSKTMLKPVGERDSSKTQLSNQTSLTSLPAKNISHRDSEEHSKTSSEKRKSLLIFGDDRSGTTFITKMFAADPQMFTVYEPLWVTKRWFKDYANFQFDFQERIVLDVVNALLSCEFTGSDAGKTFLDFTRTSWVGSGVFEKNVFRTSAFVRKTKSGKKYYPKLSSHPEFAVAACLNSFNHSVVKVGQIRVPKESIAVFIPRVFRENPDTDIRVIQIVRDPRGSINSRIRSGWVSDYTFKGFPQIAKGICSKITKNIKFARALQDKWLKDRYMEITYREIATMPITTAKKIYKFAQFQMPDSLVDWIVESTNPDKDQLAEAIDNPYSHIRDSSSNYLKWRKESPIKRVREIEKNCKELLGLLGLEPVADEMETLCG
ncbi:carbohydrate sulfotransferase 3-like [Montipora foliosa]|uniref:carbohydrate sulfotransferase 3-like n=1 Tax=Montipora foliosa TaxID=591990 RepID=UPI0035F2022F